MYESEEYKATVLPDEMKFVVREEVHVMIGAEFPKQLEFKPVEGVLL